MADASESAGPGAVRGLGEHGLQHEALLYREPGQLVAGLRDFVLTGRERGERALVVVPGEKLPALREAIGVAAAGQPGVDLVDAGSAARNPARLVPLVANFLDVAGGGRCRVAAEPVWPGRTPCERVEAARHDALLNLAFRGAPLTVLCAYDAAQLEYHVIGDAERTHPVICCGGDRLPSPSYTEPLEVLETLGGSLPPPVGEVHVLEFDHDLGRLRRFIRAHAVAASLAGARLADLLVAANEAATNTLVHTGRPGVVRVWHDPRSLVCEFVDRGRIGDPLAGRRLPRLASQNGRGLWLINQLCDLVQLRDGPYGLVLRLHVSLDRPQVRSGRS